MDPDTGNRHHRQLTNGQDTWRARYAETHTPGSEGGPGKRTGGNTSTAPGAYLTTDTVHDTTNADHGADQDGDQGDDGWGWSR